MSQRDKVRMDEIHVRAGPDNVQELRKRSATYRHTRFVLSQVAGDNVRTGGRIAELAGIAPAAQVGWSIDLFLSTEQRWRGARINRPPTTTTARALAAAVISSSSLLFICGSPISDGVGFPS
jgi:hypothetical protein